MRLSRFASLRAKRGLYREGKSAVPDKDLGLSRFASKEGKSAVPENGPWAEPLRAKTTVLHLQVARKGDDPRARVSPLFN